MSDNELIKNLHERIEYQIEKKLDIYIENTKLKNELKEANSDVGIFIEEKQEHEERISKLVSENVKLQNDLFSEQLIQDETEDYINRLKQELFSEHLKQVETEDFIDKLKRELKEYRGF